jgi:nitroreductase/NAD-dependent dihydropyrimidine dehydrogenase PreA subunit
MIITGIDNEKCIKCLECLKECPSGLFFKPPTKIGEKRVIKFKGPIEGCIECGHCIAVCPTEAILYNEAGESATFDGIKNPSSLIDYESLLRFTQTRRSIRRFKEKEVPKDQINAVLKAIRHAPTAENARSWEFLVLQNKEIIQEIRDSVIRMLRLLKKLVDHKRILKYFMPKSIRELITKPKEGIVLEDFFEKIENGEDPVFYDARVIILTYTSELNRFGDIDSGIAFTQVMLAAQALGLGTCWIGYAQEAINRNKDLKKLLGIPKDNEVNGVLVLGYPDVEYHRIPPRDPLDVEWI